MDEKHLQDVTESIMKLTKSQYEISEILRIMSERLIALEKQVAELQREDDRR